MTPETCPECGAARVRNWVYSHSRSNPACTIGDREDSTQFSDFEKFNEGRTWKSAFIRPATTAELELAGIQPTGDEKTLVRQLAAGVHHRVIAGVDAP